MNVLDLSILNNEKKYDFVSHFNSTFNQNYSCSNVSKYYRESDVISHPNINSNDVLFLSLNIQCLSSKFIELNNLLDSFSSNQKKVAIIALQETWSHSTSSFNIPGYLPFSNLRKARSGGGVGFYISNELKPELISCTIPFHEGIFETLVVKVSINNKKIILFNFYRPPTAPELSLEESLLKFHSYFNETLNELAKYKLPIVICGDVNINLLDLGKNRHSSILFATLTEFGFNLVNHKATRFSANYNSLIDIIATSNDFCEIKMSGTILGRYFSPTA